MRTARLTLVAIAALAVALLGAPSAGGTPLKVDVCHVDDEGGVRLITISDRAFETHIEHGDAAPGDPVPGMIGYLFDEACTPVSVETTFAVAYTDVVDDGAGYDPDVDVLISKLVDANGSGAPDAGDMVITDQYPLDVDATAFGRFTVNEHVVATVTSGSDRCIASAANGDQFTWADFFQGESYGEARLSATGASLSTTNILDALPGQSDLVAVADTPVLSPSQPDTIALSTRASTGDSAFFDVQFDCTP